MTVRSDINVGLLEMEGGIHRIEKQDDLALDLLRDDLREEAADRLDAIIERAQEQRERL